MPNQFHKRCERLWTFSRKLWTHKNVVNLKYVNRPIADTRTFVSSFHCSLKQFILWKTTSKSPYGAPNSYWPFSSSSPRQPARTSLCRPRRKQPWPALAPTFGNRDKAVNQCPLRGWPSAGPMGTGFIITTKPPTSTARRTTSGAPTLPLPT